MIDFAQARKNMVDCQIHTSGVVDPDLLQAFETIPREAFVPEHLQGVAYFDDNIVFEDGRSLLSPLTLSRMLEAANLSSDDVVLDIGGTTGYTAAILSSLVSTVIALDSNESYTRFAEQTWERLDVCNAVACVGDLPQGQKDKGPYDLILIEGAVPEIPEAIVEQLADNGRMLCVVKKPGDQIGHATFVQGLGEKEFSSYTLFECAAPYLDGFAPKPAFCF